MLVRVMLKCDKYVTRALLRIIYHIKTSLQVKIEVQLKISVSGWNIFFYFWCLRKISKFFMYICYHFKLDLSGLANTENCYKVGKGTSCKLAPAKVSELSNIVSIYPNPTKDILNIGNIEEENYVAKIFTFTGMQIMQTNVVDGTINISDLKRGNYILTISDRYGKNVSSQIVVKE